MKYFGQKVKEHLIDEGLEEKYGYAGIYSISINNKIVYIGKSMYMLGRIAEHITEIIKKSNSHKYQILREAKSKGYDITFDVMYRTKRKRENAIENDIGKKEGVYIRKYKPALNYQIPLTEDWHRFKVNKTAKTITLDEIMNS